MSEKIESVKIIKPDELKIIKTNFEDQRVRMQNIEEMIHLSCSNVLAQWVGESGTTFRVTTVECRKRCLNIETKAQNLGKEVEQVIWDRTGVDTEAWTAALFGGKQ